MGRSHAISSAGPGAAAKLRRLCCDRRRTWLRDPWSLGDGPGSRCTSRGEISKRPLQLSLVFLVEQEGTLTCDWRLCVQTALTFCPHLTLTMTLELARAGIVPSFTCFPTPPCLSLIQHTQYRHTIYSSLESLWACLDHLSRQ